jgi:hypothetical protein
MIVPIEDYVYRNLEVLFVNAILDFQELIVPIKVVLMTVMIMEFALIRSVIVRKDLVEQLVNINLARKIVLGKENVLKENVSVEMDLWEM